MHWVPHLFLPKEEGGQGLVHYLASWGAAFWLQFLQRLLNGPDNIVWKAFSCCILKRFSGLGIDLNLFLMDNNTQFTRSSLPSFYKSVYNLWTLLKKKGGAKQADSLHWLLQEPVLHGTILDCPGCLGSCLTSFLQAAGVTTLAQVVDLAGPRPQDSAALASKVGLRSCRVVKQLLDHWRKKLNRHELLLLDSFSLVDIAPNTQDAFPVICLTFDLKDCAGPHLDRCPKASLLEASGETFYQDHGKNA